MRVPWALALEVSLVEAREILIGASSRVAPALSAERSLTALGSASLRPASTRAELTSFETTEVCALGIALICVALTSGQIH